MSLVSIAILAGVEVPATSLFAEAASASASATATATAEATASAAAAGPVATATATRTPLFCDIHANSAAIQLLPVHLSHGLLGRFRLGERHEAEASRASRLSVGDYLGFHDFTKRRESIP